MRVPGPPSLFFLFYLLVFMPWVAIRSAQRFREIRKTGQSLSSRDAVWIGTLVNLSLMLLLAWLIGRGFGYPFFARPHVEVRAVLATLAALAACLVLRALARATRSDEERRSMVVYAIAPRTAREWVLWTLTILMASISEEVAYRGVGMSILWYSLGNAWIAALLCAIAFAVAHAPQGWKSGVVVFGIALVVHGLVAFTGTLVFAMVVHAAYDFIAGYLIAREAHRYVPVVASA
jgi:membrane protease YdiL (CAAX protease family)